jgi:hypothetical protein
MTQLASSISPKTPWLRRGAIFIALSIVALAVLLYLSHTWMSIPLDFSTYLSSTKALLNQQNAWNADQINAISHADYSYPDTFNAYGLWTPPTVMLFLVPFTFLPFPLAAYLWTFINLLLFWLAARLMHSWLPSLSTRRQIGLWLLYPPAIALLIWGQISGLVLLAYLLFIHLAQQRRDFAAGAVLIAATFKPHLGYLAVIFIAWWVFKQRRCQIALGFGAIMLVELGLITLLNPHWLIDYKTALAAPPLSFEASTISRVLYRSVFPDTPWVQFAGLIMSSAILIIYLILRQNPIDLLPTVPMLMAYSVVCAPYGWIYDQLVILPAFLWLVSESFRSRPAWWVWTLLLILSIAYYSQLWLYWGNNDSRLFWPPLLIALAWAIKMIKTVKTAQNQRAASPHSSTT